MMIESTCPGGTAEEASWKVVLIVLIVQAIVADCRKKLMQVRDAG